MLRMAWRGEIIRPMEAPMTDVLYLALGLASFGVLALYARWAATQ